MHQALEWLQVGTPPAPQNPRGAANQQIFHPLIFYSWKFTTAEINYEIHDKEFLAIVDSFQKWRHFLKGVVHPIIVYTNHKNLEYFIFA